MLAIAAVAGVVFLGGGYVIFDRFISPKLRVSASDLGLAGVVGDSPQAIVGDFLDVLKDLGNVAEGVQNAESAQAAVPKLAAIEKRLFEIQRRTLLVEPVTKEEFKTIEARFENEGKALSQKFQKQVEQIPNLRLEETEFAAVMRSIAFTLMSTIGDVKDGMLVLPEPRDEIEALALDYIKIDREQAKILARIDSESDIPQAVTEFQSLVPKFAEIAERKRQLGRARGTQLTMADTRLLNYRTSNLLLPLLDVIERQFGPQEDLRQAQVDVSTAASEYTFALTAGDTRPSGGNRGPEGTAAGNQPAGPPWGHGAGPAHAGGAPGGPRPFAGRPGTGGPGGFQSPSLPAAESVRVVLQGGPFESASHLQGQRDEFFAAKKRQTEAQKAFSAQLTELAQSNQSRATITGGTSVFELRYAGDVQELADKIDFGTVTNVDAESRTITVDMSDVEFEVEEAPAEEPATSSTGGFEV